MVDAKPASFGCSCRIPGDKVFTQLIHLQSFVWIYCFKCHIISSSPSDHSISVCYTQNGLKLWLTST